MSDPLTALSDHGVSIWLDDLSRERLVSGSLAGLVTDKHVVGMTTNPTIFAKAITAGNAHDAQLRDLAIQQLEDEGVAAFDASWDRLREQPSTTLRAQPTQQRS